MAEVTDADGVRWSVYRRWGYRYWNAMDGSSGEEAAGGLIINLLQFVVISPIWLIAKGFGAPWTIVIERNGTEVREVKVRGWRNSERCIQELAESVADETSLPPEMNVTPEAWTRLPLESKVTL